MVSGCPPDDWDCEGLLTCDAKEAESVNDGLMISGSDFMTREIHSMDEIMLKSQTTNKFCSPSDPSTMSIVSCAERHYDDEALFVIEKVDDDTAGEGSLGYPGWSPEPSGGGGGAPPGGGDAVKTVIRIRPADSPQSWCHHATSRHAVRIRTLKNSGSSTKPVYRTPADFQQACKGARELTFIRIKNIWTLVKHS